MSIKKVERADGVRYQVYGRRGGQKVYLATYDSRREAIAADEDDRTTQRKIARGELAPEHDQRRTFRVAVAAWLDMLKSSGSRSHDEYTWRNDLYFLPTFADVPIVDVGKSNVLQWRDTLAERMAATSVNSIAGSLSAAFQWFMDRDWITINPCRGIKRLKADQRVFPWLDSPDAITRLLAELSGHLRTIAAVLVGTGLRLDEALHLRWDDVDLEHRLITVHRGRQGSTKSGRARRVPIFDSVLPVLRQMKLQRGGGALLWPANRRRLRDRPHEQPWSQTSIRRPFKEAVERAGLPKQLRLHDLRHTFASLFLVDGGDIFKLSRILGHSSVAITERTYAHLKRSAFDEDYGRVRFVVPADAPGNVISLGG